MGSLTPRLLGGASYETGFCPHGGELSGSTLRPLSDEVTVSYDTFKAATEAELKPVRISEGTIGIGIGLWNAESPS